MTYWKMSGRYAPVLESGQRRSHGIPLPKCVDEETLWVQLRRYTEPQVCPHGHAIPVGEPVVEIAPIWNPGRRIPTKRYCMQHAPVPHIQLLAFKPKGKR